VQSGEAIASHTASRARHLAHGNVGPAWPLLRRSSSRPGGIPGTLAQASRQVSAESLTRASTESSPAAQTLKESAVSGGPGVNT
jgi:hypothetical protein